MGWFTNLGAKLRNAAANSKFINAIGNSAVNNAQTSSSINTIGTAANALKDRINNGIANIASRVRNVFTNTTKADVRIPHSVTDSVESTWQDIQSIQNEREPYTSPLRNIEAIRREAYFEQHSDKMSYKEYKSLLPDNTQVENTAEWVESVFADNNVSIDPDVLREKLATNIGLVDLIEETINSDEYDDKLEEYGYSVGMSIGEKVETVAALIRGR